MATNGLNLLKSQLPDIPIIENVTFVWRRDKQKYELTEAFTR